MPDALRNMTQSGLKFEPGRVTEWMDCGNKVATVETNQRILTLTADQVSIPASVNISESVILPPCFIGENVRIERSVIGPLVSIGDGTTIADSRIQNTLIQNDSTIENKVLSGSMVGNHAKLLGRSQDISVGDYNVID